MKALIIILSVHIFSIHAKLLYYLNPEIGNKNPFSFLDLSEPMVLSMIFALSYSMATAFIIYKSNSKRLIIVYAALDALGVLFYYFTFIPIYVTAFYFAIYTFILIGSTISIKDNKQKPTNNLNIKSFEA